MTDPDLITDILKMNSLSLTNARAATLQFLLERKQAFLSLNEIIKTAPGDLDRTTLYRTLLSFCTANLLYKIVDNKSRVFYGMGENLKVHARIPFLTNKDNYHFQCKSCENIFCLPLKMPLITLPAGFTKIEAHLLLSGKCDNCSRK